MDFLALYYFQSFFANLEIFIINNLWSRGCIRKYYFIFLCFLLPLTYLNYLPQHALRAFLKTKPILIAYFISGLYSLSFSYTIISVFKVNGFIFGLFSSQILILIIIFFYYLKELKKSQYQ